MIRIDGVDYDPADPALGLMWMGNTPIGVVLPDGESIVKDPDFLDAVVEDRERRSLLRSIRRAEDLGMGTWSPT